jgi:hypothetical protein
VTVLFADVAHRMRIGVTSGLRIVTLHVALRYLQEGEALLARTA